MDVLTNVSSLKTLLKEHGFTFSQSLGQNFLIHPKVCPKIAEEGAFSAPFGALEVGPGVGTLTRELAKRAEKVISLELDMRLLPILNETLSAFQNVKMIHADALKVDLKELIKEHFNGLPVVICANLPYYITTPFLMKVLEDKIGVKKMTVMVQKEVAERICAAPGTRQAGAVTLAAHYYATVKKLFSVKKGAFFPQPKVDSSVIQFEIKAPLSQQADEHLLFLLIRTAFSQRRKMIATPLAERLQIEKEEVKQALQKCGISLTARAENLTLEDFIALTKLFQKTLYH